MTPKTPKKAAALRYDHGRDQAPKVVAKGRGKIAEKIVAERRFIVRLIILRDDLFGL